MVHLKFHDLLLSFCILSVFFKKLDFTEGRNYYVDPYAQLTDLDYLMKVIKELSDANSNMYVFYSMFDLDFFVRKNYTRQSFKNEREKILSFAFYIIISITFAKQFY